MSRLIFDMPAHVYHADPCPEPSLSNSVLRTLLDESPFHAWSKHPRLGGQVSDMDTKRNLELGSAIHKLVLGRGKEVHVVDADSWRTNAAKEERDVYLAGGCIVLLGKDYEIAKAIADNFRPRVEEVMEARVEDCHTEVVLVWEENSFWRRAMIDIVSKDLRRVLDIKTTAMSVAPAEISRRLYNSGWHRQAAFYTRGLDALDPQGFGKRSFGFMSAETEAPFAISPPVTIDEFGYEIAHSDVQRGCELWDDCMVAGEWPGYFSKTPHVASPPGWIASAYEESVSNVTTQD